MKTFLYLVCLAGILFLASFIPPGKQRKITLPLKNHVGHIQWVKVIHYSAKDSSGSIVKGKLCAGNLFPYIESWTYDEYGDEIEDDKYHGLFDNLLSKTTHEYYLNGDIKEIIKDTTIQVVSKTKHYRGSDGREHYAGWGTYYSYTYSNINSETLTKYSYDSHGNMLEELTFSGDTIHPSATTIFQYNERGQLTEEDDSVAQNGSLVPMGKTVFIRDAKGREIDKATYRLKVGLIKDEKTTFDNSGDTLETFETDYVKMGKDNSLEKNEVKRFVKKTNTTYEDFYAANGLLINHNISHFDLTKHILEKSQFYFNYTNTGTENTIEQQHQTMYDKHYNVIDDVERDSGFGGKFVYENTYQYKYDRVGNWIEQLYLTAGKPDVITEREIHYFTSNR